MFGRLKGLVLHALSSFDAVNKDQNKTEITWAKRGSERCLIFSFRGHFSSELAEEAIKRWAEDFESIGFWRESTLGLGLQGYDWI